MTNTDTLPARPHGLETPRYEGLFLEPSTAPYELDDDDADDDE
ncbi:hypothetical protein ACIPW9_35905 [Streptomyces sp. NPDC090052]